MKPAAVLDCVPVERLKELFTYNPADGLLRWRHGAERPAGSVDGGYVRVTIDGRRHAAHRIVWALATGHYPASMIDHANGDGTDNRLANLRPATPRQNMQNRRSPRGARSPLLGAHWDSERCCWISRIRDGGRTHHLGRFASDCEAHEAYLAAKARIHDYKREGAA